MTYSVHNGLLSKEIKEFIEFKRKSGVDYESAGWALKAFDRFCSAPDNQKLDPQHLAEAWLRPGGDKPKSVDGCCVRQLGQYLTESGHPKAFTVLSDKGSSPRRVGVKPGPFTAEIGEFITHKRSTGRKYLNAEYCLVSFNIHCGTRDNGELTFQQLVDEWVMTARAKIGVDISSVREFGFYLNLQGSKKSFVIPYANGDVPKTAFSGYTSSFADEIISFLKFKRSGGHKYKQEEWRLRDFDIFCNEHPDSPPQQLAATFVQSRKEIGFFMGERSGSTIREFGRFLTDNLSINAFDITEPYFIHGPYAEEIAAYVTLRRSLGYKYQSGEYMLKCFDAFCASEDNVSLSPQQLADKWILKRGDEHPNSRVGRVGPVRVFGKYLTSIGHSEAFIIMNDVASGVAPNPPYLFSKYEIEAFFSACTKLQPDENDPSMHIVLPYAYLFMHCMGVRTCELKILMENVNFDIGEVIIADSKTGNRVVYMSAELTELLHRYNEEISKIFPNRKYLFPSAECRSRNDFAQRFIEIWAASVPDTEHGKPRLYDLRHHFLYRNVELCMQTGGDVNAMRPYIMKHMGHKMPESFQYYFHLSPPIRKDVSRIKSDLDWMIPDVPEVPYE